MKYVNFEEQILPTQHDFFMREALKEAHLAFEADEIPIGAIIVTNGRIIGRGHNLTQRLNDVTAHAEMQAFTAATNYLGAKYLLDCSLYVTLEPCIMCAGAAFWTQISQIVFGAYDPQRGFKRLQSSVLHPKTTLIGGVLQNECSELIKSFFQKKRKS
ncbi:MAG: nucleoside deaminase [Sphingobacteriales bacterium]|nr:MAG: nucleoside deaminase [Sphingobacteriales bacterium]TAF80919.1 MAG: nucleoside deaminase [Sphingobacteriales bacterium]